MDAKTLTEFLEDFSETEKGASGFSATTGGKPLTLWLPAEAKARYDKLQERSNRKFSKKAREALLALIAAAEARIA